MNRSLSIGIIQEGKTPPDKRVPFTPLQAQEIQQRFPGAKVVCQESASRCFKDNEYQSHGIVVTPSVDACEILIGIKELPIDQLTPHKTSLFFSHTIQKQPYNRKLLHPILQKRIRLIDYEALKARQGNPLV